MAITDTKTKLAVFEEIKDKTGKVMTEEQLVIIESVYTKNVRDAIWKVTFYRFMNVFFSLFFLLVFFFMRGTSFDEWIFVAMWTFFIIYNGIHLWNNFIALKEAKIKPLKPFNVKNPLRDEN